MIATPRTVSHQGPLSVGFTRQEYWGGLPFPPLGSSQPKERHFFPNRPVFSPLL
ncbi:hypothetical protein CapIbe_021393, partial [Capra ibex]